MDSPAVVLWHEDCSLLPDPSSRRAIRGVLRTARVETPKLCGSRGERKTNHGMDRRGTTLVSNAAGGPFGTSGNPIFRLQRIYPALRLSERVAGGDSELRQLLRDCGYCCTF